MSQSPTSVVVLGAGYAGLLFTMRLARKTRGKPVRITLVSESDTFTERLRLHQFATNQPVQWRSIPGILRGTSVEFIQGRVSALALAEKEIVLADGRQERRLPYDYLVYALGSMIDRQSVPGVEEHAYTLAPRGPHSAEALREVLPALHAAEGQVVICGGGPTGVETAAEVATAYPRLKVHLVTQGAFGQFLGNGVARRMRSTLKRKGVLITDQTVIDEIGEESLRTADRRVIPYDCCVWAGGFSVSPLARVAGLLVNARGQISIDPFMRSLSHPEVYAVGDAASPAEQPGAPVRMSAVTATIMAAHGADCVSAHLHGASPRPFSFAYVGQGIALGRNRAIGFNNYPDDQPNPPYFTGWLGYQIREWFVNFLATAPRREKHWLGSFFWIGKGRYAAAKRRSVAAPARESAPIGHA
jgi:NADH dehydrogenase FAD-containing subunit